MTRILEAVAESAAEEGISRVRALRLVVGPRSGALPDALRFAFEVLAGREPARAPAAAEGGQDGQDGKTGGEPGGEGDPIRLLFNGAILEIEEPSVRARCRRCGLEYTEEETPGRPEAPGHGHPAGFAPRSSSPGTNSSSTTTKEIEFERAVRPQRLGRAARAQPGKGVGKDVKMGV